MGAGGGGSPHGSIPREIGVWGHRRISSWSGRTGPRSQYPLPPSERAASMRVRGRYSSPSNDPHRLYAGHES